MAERDAASTNKTAVGVPESVGGGEDTGGGTTPIRLIPKLVRTLP